MEREITGRIEGFTISSDDGRVEKVNYRIPKLGYMEREITGRIEGFTIRSDDGRVYVNLTTADRSALPDLVRMLGSDVSIRFDAEPIH